jgi:GNAT superfamily N-acetyltransferase
MITFRKIEENDLSFLNEVRNFFAKDFLHDSRTFSIEETKDWFLRENPEYWIIEENSIRVGYFRINNYSKINSNLYIGADLHPDFHGRGIAHSAYSIFIPFIFKYYDLNKISLEVLSTNDRAISLYKKIGFIEEGRKRSEVLKGENFVDSIIMSILKDERK